MLSKLSLYATPLSTIYLGAAVFQETFLEMEVKTINVII